MTDQPDPRREPIKGLIVRYVGFDGGLMMDAQVDEILDVADVADRAAGIRRVTAEQITAHLQAEQERLGWCSGDNEHWHGGMQSAADAVREFFEDGPR